MWHPFPGFSGAITSIVICAVLWFFRRATKIHPTYNLGPGGDPKAYEPIMDRYIRLSEFMIGAATGSIVLVVGSSALHGSGGKLAWFYASPLLLLAAGIIYGIGFMACQILTYEEVSHGNPHTAANYALNETLGFSSLCCFVVGYIWLIIAVTNL
ncbi:MAG TPA: hypothetical protein VNU94_03160 [Acidobacteriaceae bacterium]|jgi:hypothetical protein|nr:hypothetical protein [Acidobacteriaceae bacterium]